MAKKLTSCPYCGSKQGFYIEADYIAVKYKVGFNGEESDNEDMFDTGNVKERRYAYCIDCGARLGNANRIYNQARREIDKRRYGIE